MSKVSFSEPRRRRDLKISGEEEKLKNKTFGVEFFADANNPFAQFACDAAGFGTSWRGETVVEMNEEAGLATCQTASLWFRFPEPRFFPLVLSQQAQLAEEFRNFGWTVKLRQSDITTYAHDHEAEEVMAEWLWGSTAPTDEQLALFFCEGMSILISKPDQPPVWDDEGRRLLEARAERFACEIGVAPQSEWVLASGQRVVDRHNSHLHTGVKPLIDKAASQVSMSSQDHLEVTIDFAGPVGLNNVVGTNDDDFVFYAQRPGRKGLSRFVMGRRPEVTNQVTLVLHKAQEENTYILLTAWVGPKAPREPWDQFATPDSRGWWNTHAFTTREPHDHSTLTETCPW